MSSEGMKLQQIKADLDDAGNPWEAGVTSMSGLTFDEQKAYLGVTPPPGAPTIEEIAQQSDAERTAFRSAALAAGAPSVFDLRNVAGKNFVTPIKDQASCGSCVAFGTSATVESKTSRAA